MSKASNKELNELHALIAEVLKSKLKSDDCSAQDIAQAIKFLKDNGVIADADYNKTLQELNDSVVNIKTLPFPVAVGDED